MAETICISDVPGLAKHTSTPALRRVCNILSAPFIGFVPYSNDARNIRHPL
jgi:hypothetical protein